MSDLRLAAVSFVRAACELLEARLPSHAPDVDLLPRWHNQSGRLFVLGPLPTSAVQECFKWEYPAVRELPQAHVLTTAIENDTSFKPLLGRLVGSPMSGYEVEVDRLQSTLLWGAIELAGGLQPSSDAFSAAYENWLAETFARQVDLILVSPIAGLELESNVELAPGLELGNLTDDEISACLQMRALATPFAPATSTYVQTRAGIRSTVVLPHGPMDAFTETVHRKAQESRDAARATSESVADALRLFRGCRISISGHVEIDPLGGLYGGPTASSRWRSTDLVLSAADMADFCSFWLNFVQAQGHKALAAAARRFGYAAERARRDDEIVDLVAALEALLLSDVNLGGEYRYRTALRGAVLIDHPTLSRREVQKQLGRAYNIRSAVAHGGAPKKADLRSATDEAVTLDDFVAEVEEFGRLALSKAVTAIAAKKAWPPDWDGLILEGGTYA